MEESTPDVTPSNRQEANSSQPQVARTYFDPRTLYYDMRGQKYLFIFNHYQYEKTKYFDNKRPRTRHGTVADVLRLTTVFKSLDFEVISHTDLKYEDIIEKIRTDVIGIDHTNTACICIAILTHGEEGGELFAKDRPYALKNITTMMENQKLVTIPKLFFVQACRGGKADDGVEIHYDGTPRSVIHLPTHIDFLIVQSSVEGYVSYRGQDGSWLIQALCDVITEYHEEYDILQMLTLMNKNIALNCVSNSPNLRSYHKKKQTVETRFTLAYIRRAVRLIDTLLKTLASANPQFSNVV